MSLRLGICFSIIESPQPKFVLQDLQHPLETLKADREYLLGYDKKKP